MRAAARRLRTWSTADYFAIVESFVFAAIVEVALVLLPMSAILEMIEGIRPARRSRGRAIAPERLARFAAAPYRLLFVPPHCLRQSLVLCALLRRRGAAARVCFGVDRKPTFAAHAWVAIAGTDTRVPVRFHELPRPWSV